MRVSARRCVASPVVLSALFALLAGCGTFADTATNGTACRADTDCPMPGRCGSAGVCEAIVVPESVPPPICTISAECDVAGASGVGRCADSACVPIKDEAAGCDSFAGRILDDGAIVLGVFYTKPSVLPTGASAGNYLEFLAERTVEDWNNAASAVGAQKSRRAAVVLCDEAKDPAKAVAHMQRLGVSAIIGPLVPARARIAVAAARAKETPFLALYDQSSVPFQGTRSCAAVRKDLGAAAAHAIRDISARESAKRGRPLNLSVVSSNLSEDLELDAVLVPKLTEGDPTETLASVTRFSIEIDFDQPVSGRAKLLPRSALPPDIVVLNAEYVHGALISQIDANWTQTGERPVYVLVGQGASALALEAAQQGPSTLNGRVYALDWAAPAASVGKVRGDVDAELSVASGDRGVKFVRNDLAYVASDCLYAGLFASAAATTKANIEPSSIRNETFTQGIDLVTGLLGGSPTVTLRASSLPLAKSLIAGGARIATIGASGVLRFAPDGTRVGLDTLEVRCLVDGHYVTSSRSYDVPNGADNGAPFDCGP